MQAAVDIGAAVLPGARSEIHCEGLPGFPCLTAGPTEEIEATGSRAPLPLSIIKAGDYGQVVVVDARGKRAWSNPFWPV